MLEKVRHYIKQNKLLDKGDRVIVGVSGGPDSVALLHVLKLLQTEYHLSLHVAHFNHMFRGQEAVEDAQFVERFASELDLPCTVKAEDVPAYIKEHSLSSQDGARKLRYKFLYELMKEIGAAKIALGHHADDQAETVLLHLLRGSGLQGLAGISPKRGTIIRPLLSVSRQEIEDYCARQQLSSRTDPSNFKAIYTRNKIRLELLPLLQEEFNPNIVQNLNNMSQILSVENEFLDKMTAEAFRKLASISTYEIALTKEGFLGLDKALQRRLIRNCFERIADAGYSLNYKYVRQAELFIQEPVDEKKLGLPGGIVLKKGDTAIIFTRPPSSDKSQSYKILLEVPGEQILPNGIRIDAQEVSINLARFKCKNASKNEAYLDLEKISLPLTVRSRKAGDVFRPLGVAGTKKLKDFLIDQKVPVAGRNDIPIITDYKGKIIWVGGYRIDDNYKITSNTKKALYLSMAFITG